MRDRQPCYDQRVYNLPDNGKGIPVELPVPYTLDCPEYIFESVNIKRGPCRVTSVSEGLDDHQNDPFMHHHCPKEKEKYCFMIALFSQKYAENNNYLRTTTK